MPLHDQLGHGKNLERYLLNHSTPDGSPSAELWRQGLMQYFLFDVDASILWKSVGPAPLTIEAEQNYQGKGPDSGEVTDIAIDPDGSADQVIYIATNDGGIWKTVDGGKTWNTTMDDLLGLSMGAVAIDASSPPNARVVYAGTGNMYDGGWEFTKGVGVYRSPDGGATWSIVDGGPFGTIFAGLYITAIMVLATDTLLVASNSGLYRSVDGGQNFGSNSPSFDNRRPVINGLITCLLRDPTNPNTVYAGLHGTGVMKSTDGGASFPTNLFNPANGAPVPPIGNVEVAQAEKAPQLLYASVQNGRNPNATYVGLYQSTDGGQHWTLLPSLSQVANGDGFSQTDYDLTVGVDPVVTVTGGSPSGPIYVGFQELWRSKDGGQTFQGPPACTYGQTHWDIHVLALSPKSNRSGSAAAIYLGTDGGIYKSSDGGHTWVAINGNIGSNLFLGIDIGKGTGNNAYTYGGCQDTGNVGHWPTDNDPSWHLGIDGDGKLVAVDPSDPKTVYGFDDAALYKSTDAGATWTPNQSLPSPSNDWTRALALELNGADPTQRIVYVGVVQTLYKSTDAGTNFTSVFSLPGGAGITAVATTQADSNCIWVGGSNGTVHYSADAGAAWDQGSLPAQTGVAVAVTSIAIDANNPARVAVAYGGQSGIRPRYRTQRIFLSTDNGATWNDVSGTDGDGPQGNLPDLPLHSVVFDTSVNPSALVVAGDAGVMRCENFNVGAGGVTAKWRAYGVGLPTVSCSSLAIDNSVNPPVLRVGTYGRSCFEATRPTGPRIYVGPNLGFGAVPADGKGTLSLEVYNCGDAPLSITGIAMSGSDNFTLNPVPAFPISVAPAKSQSFSVVFMSVALGEDAATLQVNSSDPASPCIRKATGRGVAARAPRLAVNPTGQSDFGVTSAASPRSIPLQLFNVGTKDLHISAITLALGSSDFSLDPASAFPVTIAPGADVNVNITYRPSTNGAASATFQIVSNDPLAQRTLDVVGTGNGCPG